ncbi:MAG: hypothetical protein JXB45_03810 [Candidatus Krumholzibacteriota bacterium]|nr:hypothetical protein [Candidatus Krumholzibacteriota bacterium]
MRRRFLIVWCVLALTPAAAGADIPIVLGTFTSTYDAPLSLVDVGMSIGNSYLQGLDYPGEWVEYTGIECADGGDYKARLRVRGDLDIPYEVGMVVSDAQGQQQLVTFNFIGEGLG